MDRRTYPAESKKRKRHMKNRSRGGCLQCKMRRVKCCETKPVCNRCKKRQIACSFECSYSADQTEFASSNCSTNHLVRAAPSTENTSMAGSCIRDPEEQCDATWCDDPKAAERTVEGCSKGSNKSLHHSPATETTIDETIAGYLDFQSQRMTHYHYMLLLDLDDVVHGGLIHRAREFKPLLYAVVAFAAYHCGMQRPDYTTDLDAFWNYYHTSITLLRASLETGGIRVETLLLTILHLALIEEYIGLRLSLKPHRDAAHRLLVNHFTAESVLQTSMGRMVFSWFVRLDTMIASMDTTRPLLDHDWLMHAYDWYKTYPGLGGGDALESCLGCLVVGLQIVRHDIACLTADVSRGRLSQTESVRFCGTNIHHWMYRLRCFIDSMRSGNITVGVDQGTRRVSYSLPDSGRPPFEEDLWALNLIYIDWYTTRLLLCKHKIQNQVEETYQQDMVGLSEEMLHAKAQCNLVQAVKEWSTSPSGSLLTCGPGVALSAEFLAQASAGFEEVSRSWIRHQLAVIESQGYLYPSHFRTAMASLWDEPDMNCWWLPEGEGKSSAVTKIRTIVEGFH